MFIARMVFFRLHESPRYLVHAGRHQEAVESLQLISKFNGSELSLDIEDVRDHLHPSEIISDSPAVDSTAVPSHDDVVFDADHNSPGHSADSRESTRPKLTLQGSRLGLRDSPDSDLPGYSSTGEPNVSLSGHTFLTPDLSRPDTPMFSSDNPYLKDASRRSSNASLSSERAASQRPYHARERSASSLKDVRSRLYYRLPLAVSRPLWAWVDRVAMVLAPEWVRTTVLVWIAWCAMSLGGDDICSANEWVHEY
jgi:hypothetical protein